MEPDKTLEEILIQLDLENPSKKIIHKLKHTDLDRLLTVLKKLKERFGYEGMKENDNSQLDKLLQISKFNGMVLEAIDALADSNWYIGDSIDRYRISSDDVDIIQKISKSNPKRYSAISKKLIGRLGYKGIKRKYDIQFARLFELSKLNGKVLEAIDALADANYHIGDIFDRYRLHPINFKHIQTISEENPKMFSTIAKKLIERLGYEGIRMGPKQFKYLLQISQIEGNVLGAIEILPTKTTNNKIRKLNKNHVEEIRTIAKKLDYFTLNKFCIYRENTDLFIDYFNNRSYEEKKNILEAIMSCKHENEGVTSWLDKNEPELIKDIGLGQ